ncbi:hypothetical protein N798_11265 [Knoellia flava TL1]|uniref:Uncharacterized protein n=2 Tax=Knoellia flava TaxID=913969 RepID=A0A8H9KT80_9MICO|nr:hypothetical protein [Knoellia flava]KGN30274.1 hypothetical protein N798_11265 [Knoellia flava TL1]GGB84442.1 hypothetical protein GCM10011314_25110 [Knoellia flava]
MTTAPESAAADVPTETPVRLLVGAANFAGQGRLWAEAAATLPEVAATSFSVGSSSLTVPAHHIVERDVFEDPVRSVEHERWVRSFTHVLVEAGRPVTGTTRGKYAPGDVAALTEAGVVVGLVAHGSDVRRPDGHLRREPDSPFHHADDRTLTIRQAYADLVAPLTDSADWGFVSTPDLLDDVPHGRWLPVVVDVARWEAPTWQAPPPGEPLRVVHVPSDSFMKGTEQIEPALHRLSERGVIAYEPIRGVPQERMPQVVAGADVVLDQFALGSYGVAAVEAMAAGRAVVGHVRDEVRGHVLATTGHALPILQARAGEIEAVLVDLAENRHRLAEAAEEGPVFVSAVHDGRMSASVLADFLSTGAVGRPDREP